MKEHPINEILKTSLENIGRLVDVNKVIGEPMILPNEIIAIPVSKVICGYGVGGSQFNNKSKLKNLERVETSEELFPFGGASGGGLTIKPQALILIKKDKIQLMNIDKENDFLNTTIDAIKEIFKK